MGGCIALIVGAGRGHRFGGDVPKQYQGLGGVALIRRTLMAFINHPDITGVRVVIHPDDRDLYDAATLGMTLGATSEMTSGVTLLEPVNGGETRQDSVRLGLESLAAAAPDKVLIHDAARPFVAPALISQVITGLDDEAGVIPALAVRDTLKRADDDGTITATVDRNAVWQAQTPQGFRYADILAAHQSQRGNDLTDDGAVAEASGMRVILSHGSVDNFKITTADDLKRAENRMDEGEYRTGSGYDVHRFGAGHLVTLCGVEIPHDRGLEGHSDADVGLHALTDAILGAIGNGDIGEHFPPTDATWKDASSGRFLSHAAHLATAAGGRIINVDVTLICEAPRVGPHRDAMVARIAELLEVSQSRVSVKATTTEKLGFTGRGEGIAAEAVATIRLPRPFDD